MKKSILFIPNYISLSIVEYTMNYNQSISDKVMYKPSLNIDKLINHLFY